MGCCILGAIIFGLLLRSWRSIRRFFGLPSAAVGKVDPAMWRPGLSQPSAVLAAPRPFLSYRMAAALLLLPLLAYGAYCAPAYAQQAQVKLAYAAASVGLPVDALLALCGGRS